MPSEITDLWNDISILEDRLARQRMNIMKIQLNLDEDDSDMSQVEGEPVLELKKIESFEESQNDEEDVKYEDTMFAKTKLTIKNSHRIERKLLNIVKTEAEESFADTKMQHSK